MLTATHLTVRYPGAPRAAVADVTVTVRPGELVAVVGPNGSGKTTLARALLGAVPAVEGSVVLANRPIGQWTGTERARQIGFVAQREEYPFAWRVRELVEFGRYPWLKPLASPSPRDAAAVDSAMRQADVAELADRRIDTLSGGEWQRVRIARALAQESRILLLDEPTAALDLGHEMEIFELVAQLVRGGLAALVVTHNLNLASRFGDQLLLLDQGVTVRQGAPADVLVPEVLEAVFGWPVEVGPGPDGAPQVVAKRAVARGSAA